MFRIVACITENHDVRLVFLAAAICLLAAMVTFALLGRARAAERQQTLWVTAAAIVTGSGVWATHFVAMLAFRPGLPFSYEIEATVLSVVAAILITWIGLAIALSSPRRALAGGAVVGIATTAMHYLGMSALVVPGELSYDNGHVVASIALGGSLIALAFGVSAHRDGIAWKAAGAGLLTLGICTLHFIAMAALAITPLYIEPMFDHIEAPAWIAIAVAGITFVILAFGLIGILIDQHLSRRAVKEAERLREHVAALEATKLQLEQTAANLSGALNAAAAANQAKSQFLATMSHELRTPLNAIIGFSETIISEAFGPIGNPRYSDYIKDIRDSGSHLLSVINDILDLAKLDAGHLDFRTEALDPRAVVADAVRFVRGQAADAGLTVTQEVAAEATYFLGDARRVRQVLLNLLSNAVKFTPPGGTIKVAAARNRNRIRITVTDTGIGMSPEQIPIALERFGQIDNSLARRYEGSGLGLPLAKRLVEQQSGRFAIESALGQGTTIAMEFPVTEAPADSPAPGRLSTVQA